MNSNLISKKFQVKIHYKIAWKRLINSDFLIDYNQNNINKIYKNIFNIQIMILNQHRNRKNLLMKKQKQLLEQIIFY